VVPRGLYFVPVKTIWFFDRATGRIREDNGLSVSPDGNYILYNQIEDPKRGHHAGEELSLTLSRSMKRLSFTLMVSVAAGFRFTAFCFVLLPLWVQCAGT
jgi:hypothetical protein